MQKIEHITSDIDLRRELNRQPYNMFMLLDGSRFENVFDFIHRIYELPEYYALYMGTHLESAVEVSPCLLRIYKERPEFLDWYLKEGASAHQAILLTSPCDLESLALHFRHYLDARLPNREIALFRFYDPGILNAILPFRTKPQVAELLALCESLYWYTEGKLHRLSGDKPAPDLFYDPNQMFEIDTDLQKAMSGVVRKRAVERSLRDFKMNFPMSYALAGEEKTREFLSLAWNKAEHYNMTSDREVKGFILLMNYLGCDFDGDPLFPWARFPQYPYAKPRSETRPMSLARLKEVYKAFIDFHRHTDGAKDGRLIMALRNTLTLGYENLHHIKSFDDIMAFLQKVYPQRYNMLPEQVLRTTILQEARAKSREYGMNTWVGCALCALLIFFYGISFDNDPLHAEIGKFVRRRPPLGDTKEEYMLQCIKEVAKKRLDEAVSRIKV